MSFLEKFSSFMNLDAPIIILAVVLVVAGIVNIIPLGDLQNIAKLTLAIVSGAAGVWVIYHSLMSRSKIDDFLGALFGMLLLGISAYLGFGFNVLGLFSQYVSALQASLPYIIAAILALAGIVLVTRKDKLAQIMGIFLIISAMATFGINYLGLFKWW